MIPKVIHYCWFGNNPKPELAQKCIDSWKKFLPDYEIREWNENNFDCTCCDYVREAYESGKWAFVSDYARFKILFQFGGLYFDTDVELLSPIDHILEKGSFMAAEEDSPLKIAVGLGFGANPGNAVIKEIVENYEKIHFHNSGNTSTIKTVVEYVTEILENRGLKEGKHIQCIDGIYIYPKEYFNPYDLNTGKIKLTEKTVSIHHYAASWVDKYSKFRGAVYKFLNRTFGNSVAELVRKFVAR